ncbi:MAG: glycosyltransferase, partial [Peptococcaceae bacterium]|nr:glycosyltransferase [Peptococcaceae bacterium]
PFGLVGLEAMAHGVPVVAFDLGGVREYVNESTGELIPEKNIAHAAEVLKQLYLHPERLGGFSGMPAQSVLRYRDIPSLQT